MKKYYFDNDGNVAFFEVDDNLTFPCNVNITNRCGHLVNKDAIPAGIEVEDNLQACLLSLMKAHVDTLNNYEVDELNGRLARHEYRHCRMKDVYKAHVTATLDSDVFTLSLSHKPVDVDLMGDEYHAGNFKRDVSDLFDYAVRIASGDSKVSRSKYDLMLKAFYRDQAPASVFDDDFKLDGEQWEGYKVTTLRKERLDHCLHTKHNTSKDYFFTDDSKARKALFCSVLLADDDTILRTKDSVKTKK